MPSYGKIHILPRASLAIALASALGLSFFSGAAAAQDKKLTVFVGPQSITTPSRWLR
jgi:ABC-type sugar transport system substrate-binding protein